MKTDADEHIARILSADESFLIEVGRLTLLFSRIEDILAHDALYLAQLSEDQKLRNAAVSKSVLQLRILEKRDLLKRAATDIGRFYDVDHHRVSKMLDELGVINGFRRSVVHGWIRWSAADQRAVLVDSRGRSIPAWPKDVLELNLKVLNWIREYYAEQQTLMESVLHAYTAMADRLLRHPKLSKLSPERRALLTELIKQVKTDLAGTPADPPIAAYKGWSRPT